MRKYPERERVRLAPSSVSKEEKKKEKMGHWMFRVLSLARSVVYKE
jgi:hypothetical protein